MPDRTEAIINAAFDKFDADLKRIMDENQRQMDALLVEWRATFGEPTK